MKVSRIRLRNWRNFRDVEIPDLPNIAYLVGPNASGKSNLLDALSFIRDIANTLGGGIQQAVYKRGGMKKLRCLYAENNAHVEIEIDVSDEDENLLWTYSLSFGSSDKNPNAPRIKSESVTDYSTGKPQELIAPRYENDLDADKYQQTCLEPSLGNQRFRVLAEYLGHISYFQLIPQMLKLHSQMGGMMLKGGPFGQSLIDRMSSTDSDIRASILNKIEASLKDIIPQLEEFGFGKDEFTGKPHLHLKFDHGELNGAIQREDQISDGILRLIAILWTCYEFSKYPVLIEEPELSLSNGILEDLHCVFVQSLGQSQDGGQFFLSTHNRSLLSNPGINTRSFVVIEPGKKGSHARKASESELLVIESGFPASEAILNTVENSTKITSWE